MATTQSPIGASVPGLPSMGRAASPRGAMTTGAACWPAGCWPGCGSSSLTWW
jgi:hypothetical protein